MHKEALSVEAVMKVLSALVLCGFAAVGNAKTVTLSGPGVTITYEDKAVAVLGVPSLIATSLMSPTIAPGGEEAEAGEAPVGFPALLAGGQERRLFKLSALPREVDSHSFSEGAALRFLLVEAETRDGGIYSLLLAGAGLFGLIARQRLAGLLRGPQSARLL